VTIEPQSRSHQRPEASQEAIWPGRRSVDPDGEVDLTLTRSRSGVSIRAALTSKWPVNIWSRSRPNQTVLNGIPVTVDRR